jgi:hypothetical protein
MFQRVSHRNFGAVIFVKTMRLVALFNHYGNICWIVAQVDFHGNCI